MSDGLTDKQRVFVHEYLKDWNATRAAIAAGYSKKTAAEMGYENLKKPHIAKYIEEAQQNIQKIAGVSVLGNISELQKILQNTNTTERDKIKVIEVINKMLGFNEPDKKDLTTNGKEIKGISPIEWVDDEED
jgi:phage terminase small subunit